MEPTPKELGQAVKRAATLADLAGAAVIVPIRFPDGRTVEVPMRQISEQRVWEIRREITWPKPPVKDATKSGLVYDRQDPAFLAATEDAWRLFNHKLLLETLQIEIPGADEAEQIANFQHTVGQAAYVMLMEASQRLNVAAPEEIAAVADSFRPG